MTMAEPELAFVQQLARDAGALLLRYQLEGFTVSHKAAIDLVTTADRASEALVIGAISARYPSHVIISEESRAIPLDGSSRGRVWYIDPLDGTTSFVHAYPAFAVSIALYDNEQPQLAVIYDPLRDELFSAQRGRGAWLNGQLVQVSQTQHLIESLLTSGFPYDVHESGRNIESYQQLTLLSRGVRISGSSALDLAWVACGRLDGYWEPQVAPWDAAAGALIVREAGGRVSDAAAAEWQPLLPSIIASNGRLHELLLREIEVG